MDYGVCNERHSRSHNTKSAAPIRMIFKEESLRDDEFSAPTRRLMFMEYGLWIM